SSNDGVGSWPVSDCDLSETISEGSALGSRRSQRGLLPFKICWVERRKFGFGAGSHGAEHILKRLIGTAPVLMGPGFFAPLRNGELIRWLFANGFRATWPAM